MDNRKHKFITDLLESKKITAAQKERVMKLAAKEMGSFIPLEKRVQKIEGVVFKENAQTTITYAKIKSDSNLPELQYPIIHTPFKTVALLKHFTENDKDLKYTTHSWEKGKYQSYDEFMLKIRNEWNGINSELKEQSIRLHAKISNFLFNSQLGDKNKKGFHISWGEDNLKFGWASLDLKKHMADINNSPFTCPIPQSIRELDKGYDLMYFKDYADVFKNEIEFREDTKNLRKLISNLWESELSFDFKIKGLEKLEGISFFTDVQWTKEALKQIFEMFSQNDFRHFPNVVIERKSQFGDENFHLIKITQIGSNIGRSVDDPKIKAPTGNLASIIEKLKNLCDYSIVSRFADDKLYRINYLSSKFKEQVELVDNDFPNIGFTHELKFYL